MNRLIVCVGNYATIPYRINYLKMDVYCIEEFCYYLCEYTNLLDRDLMEKNLVEWIDKQCGLNDLAISLDSFLQNNIQLSVFVATILKYVHFVEDDRIREIEKVLRQNEGLTSLERKKQRADNLFLEKKYYFGLDLYHELLKEIPVTEEEFLAKILFNCGVSYANLFYFEIAFGMFERSLNISKDERAKEACLYCKRNLLSKQEYVQYIANHTEFYEASLTLEQKLRGLKSQWNQSSEKQKLDLLFAGNDKQDLETQRALVNGKLDIWQEAYRTMVRLK